MRGVCEESHAEMATGKQVHSLCSLSRKAGSVAQLRMTKEKYAAENNRSATGDNNGTITRLMTMDHYAPG